jgi:hypothetical protein
MKEWRLVIIRYETDGAEDAMRAASFIGVLCLVDVFDWIKRDFKP